VSTAFVALCLQCVPFATLDIIPGLSDFEFRKSTGGWFIWQAEHAGKLLRTRVFFYCLLEILLLLGASIRACTVQAAHQRASSLQVLRVSTSLSRSFAAQELLRIIALVWCNSTRQPFSGTQSPSSAWPACASRYWRNFLTHRRPGPRGSRPMKQSLSCSRTASYCE
jgi:hypothetical protein